MNSKKVTMQTNGIVFLKGSGKVLAIFGLLLAAGCSSKGGTGNYFPAAGDNPIKIESSPSGAEVYVMGERIGVTPVQISQKDVFPNIYPHEKESVYGKVTLKKAGCTDFTKAVSTEISANGLRARLECEDANPVSSRPTTDAPAASENIEQRLDKVRDLLNKGLITEEEAQKARARILNEL